MLAPSRKRPVPLLLVFTFAFLFLLCYRSIRIPHQGWVQMLGYQQNVIAANRTLGFGAIVVVSKDGSDRRHALLQAANVTDIDLVIPRQPEWTELDIDKFRNGQEEAVQRGSLLAWLGHLNALQWFLQSDFETALVLEDDVDWDVRLRSVQVPLAAGVTRSLLAPQQARMSPGPARSIDVQFWGDLDAWDLLYLGHCGDYFHQVTNEGLDTKKRPLNLDGEPYVVYEDPTLPGWSELHPFTQELFGELDMPPLARVLHQSKFPLCSFGYAITRPAAQRLVDDLASPKLHDDGPRAFDVALLHACTRGPGSSQASSDNPAEQMEHAQRQAHTMSGLRCWTINPELFHHMPGRSQIASVEEELGVTAGVPPVDRVGQEQVALRNETANIDCGFWSGAFGFAEGDAERLQFLREEVGRKGRCAKPGRVAPRGGLGA